MTEFAQYFAHHRHTGNVVSDGRWVYYISDTSGQFNLWKIPAGGGYARQMTDFSDHSVRLLALAPSRGEIYFLADHNGDEAFSLYGMATENGWPEPVLNQPGVRHEMHPESVSPDGRWLLYTANDREPAARDVCLLDLATRQSRRLIHDGRYWVPCFWMPDGSRVVLLSALANTQNALYLGDPSDGQLTLLSPSDREQAVFQPVAPSPDGMGLVVVTNYGREFQGLARIPLIPDGSMEWLLAPHWDVEGALVSPDATALLWSVNEHGFSRLYLGQWDKERLASARPLEWPASGTVLDLVFDPKSSEIIGYANRAQHPTELYRIDPVRDEVRQLTDESFGGLDDHDLIAPEIVTYPGGDELEISALFYRPRGEGPFPAILIAHGGPEAQERPLYIGLYQYLLSRGIALLAPNFRGSTGYGKSFQKRIYHDWGGKELEDLVRGAQWLGRRTDVDASRIGAFGASFGGFAVLSLISRHPEFWRAAAEVVGPSNLITFVNSVPPAWRRFMAELVGDPETEADFLLERSPVTYGDRVRCPLLVIQGGQDPRVNRQESEQWVQAMRARGVEVEYCVYEDEGHGFTKRSNQLEAWQRTADFLIARLTGER